MDKEVLIIGPFPPPTSGVSFANEILAKGLKRKNWRVGSINTEYSKEVTEKHGNLDFRKINFFTKYFFFYKILFYKTIYMTIGQSFFGVLKYAPFIVIAKLFRKNLIVHLHGNHLLKEYDSLQGIKKKIFFWLISMFDHGIVLSESLKQNFLPFIAKKNIHVVYNFVDDNLILPDYELSRKKDFSEIRLFFMSNLLAEKGINLLLGAVQKLNLEGQLVKVKVAGTKIAGNNIDNMLESLPNVEYVGIVHNTKKQDLLIWGNVFCLPTSFNMEGQPISILEAMALNNLIVTTKHAGIPDICTDENAVFCEKNNEEDLYIKLKDVISHWEVLKGKAVMNGVYAREQFSEQKFIANIEDIILNKV